MVSGQILREKETTMNTAQTRSLGWNKLPPNHDVVTETNSDTNRGYFITAQLVN